MFNNRWYLLWIQKERLEVHQSLPTATWTEGKYKLNISFCAVNAQAGDGSIDYILYSDQVGQAVDWTLPVSGVIGAVEAGGTVSTWNQAIRIIAGWDDDSNRTLKIGYFDSQTGNYAEAEVIKETNKDDYVSTDFRSDIANVLVE